MIMPDARRLSIEAEEIEGRTTVKEGRWVCFYRDRHLSRRTVSETDGVRR
jgi:hypothetical protein